MLVNNIKQSIQCIHCTQATDICYKVKIHELHVLHLSFFVYCTLLHISNDVQERYKAVHKKHMYDIRTTPVVPYDV
jgi:hypothetical protein